MSYACKNCAAVIMEDDEDMCHDCRFESRGAKTMNQPSEWISVKDRLPDLYESVLCFTGRVFVITYRTLSNDIEVWSEPYNITHWMELPKPPKENL